MIALLIAQVLREVRILLRENICDIRLLQINGRSRLLRDISRENHRKRLLRSRISSFLERLFANNLIGSFRNQILYKLQTSSLHNVLQCCMKITAVGLNSRRPVVSVFQT